MRTVKMYNFKAKKRCSEICDLNENIAIFKIKS